MCQIGRLRCHSCLLQARSQGIAGICADLARRHGSGLMQHILGHSLPRHAHAKGERNQLPAHL